MLKYMYEKKAGSYTIELSLLTPMIIAIFLFIYFSAIYSHDRNIIERAGYISALRAALCVDVEEREYIAAENFEKEVNEKLLGLWDLNTDYAVDNDKVVVTVKGQMSMGEGLLRKIIGEKMYSYDTECISYSANETEYLRNYKKGK